MRQLMRQYRRKSILIRVGINQAFPVIDARPGPLGAIKTPGIIIAVPGDINFCPVFPKPKLTPDEVEFLRNPGEKLFRDIPYALGIVIAHRRRIINNEMITL